MLSIIVAKSKNNVIGKDNGLIWHLKDDLKRFKELTTGHTIIMGRKTFNSLGRVLPNRFHIVISNNKDLSYDNPNVRVINNIDELNVYINDNEEHFVIGGESIYKLLMPKCQRLYVTEIDKEFEGDTFFPEIDMGKWKIVSRVKGPVDEENDFNFYYVLYELKKGGKDD